MMENAKILITGGAGFIGSHLTETLLKKGYQVTVLDNCSAGNKLRPKILQQIEFIDGDVRNLDLVFDAAQNSSAIIHLAAVVGVDEVIKREIETIETESIGTQNIVKAAKRFGVKKIIYASSSAVYGKGKNDINKECGDLHLVNAYAVAKRLNEMYLNSLTLDQGISTNSLRFFNVYGCRQDNRMVVSRFFEQAMLDQPIEVFGDGQQTRDFTHVDDVISAILTLLFSPTVNGIFNISRGVETNIKQLAEMVKRIGSSPDQGTRSLDILV